MKPGLIAILTGTCGGCGMTYTATEGETIPREALMTHRVEYCDGESYCEIARRCRSDGFITEHLHATCRLCGKVRVEDVVK